MDANFISDSMINPALAFIHRHLPAGEKVFIYCSKGESRSPSLALMHLLEQGDLVWHSGIFQAFKEKYYANYNPEKGNRRYMEGRWGSRISESDKSQKVQVGFIEGYWLYLGISIRIQQQLPLFIQHRGTRENHSLVDFGKFVEKVNPFLGKLGIGDYTDCEKAFADSLHYFEFSH